MVAPRSISNPHAQQCASLLRESPRLRMVASPDIIFDLQQMFPIRFFSALVIFLFMVFYCFWLCAKRNRAGGSSHTSHRLGSGLCPGFELRRRRAQICFEL
jgi:hypothetical protein